MKLTIGKKLTGAFFLIALLLAVTAGIDYYFLTKLDESYTDLLNRRAVIVANSYQMQVQAAKQSNSLRGYLLTEDQQFLDSMEKYHNQLNQLISDTRKLVQADEDLKKLQELENLNQQFKAKYTDLLKLTGQNEDRNQIVDLFTKEVLPLGRQLEPVADEIATRQQQLMEEGSSENKKAVDTSISSMVFLSMSTLVLALLIGYLMSRMISRPIVQIAAAAELVASGDLTKENLAVKNNDEIGQLAASFNQMAANLRGLISQINLSAESVAASSEELSASAEQTSCSAETISSSIQEIVVSADRQARGADESVQAINQMSIGIQQIAENTQRTAALSLQAAEKSLEGNQAVQVAVKQMDSLESTIQQLAKAVQEMGEYSKEVGLIVDVMSEIATQTNLLALNAAIEAARAGEHGRGFAIVADEVRKLAEQSAESASRVTQMIESIQQNTQDTVERMERGIAEASEGRQAVHSAGRRFGEIKGYVDEVTSQIQQISAASQQVAASTEQVKRAANEISEGSKLVAASSQTVSASAEEQLATVEEVSSSAASLARMAEELRALVGKFKV
ncbi:methyl-accepting chemotaxis protein [Brevibacillus sp. B_LB10_24]|uniref:methyl-accepting chemotaxis protein n=1 Tax=Brevibacillus sp. B_LB10_24 TaxID=3380645 RepID=UPI0038B98864